VRFSPGGHRPVSGRRGAGAVRNRDGRTDGGRARYLLKRSCAREKDPRFPNRRSFTNTMRWTRTPRTVGPLRRAECQTND
jgi:hypothetical protein